MERTDRQSNGSKFLTVAEVMQWLNLSKATVYRIKDAMELPHYKFLGGIRFSRKDVEEYIERCCQRFK